ncbi:MAG: Inner membrane protein YhaI [Candidatus Celerinatantimonas neptuna]|nr:MAG: Inner membrane protein YhaI [Candidatus Celerinatantimonas neptuna]
MRWYWDVLKKYFVFSGRARRKEYWMFLFINLLIIVVLQIALMSSSVSGDINRLLLFLFMVYPWLTLIPSIAVSVRRLHDIGYSGWWYLLNFLLVIGNIIFLIMMCKDGNKGLNRFGKDPKLAEPISMDGLKSF